MQTLHKHSPGFDIHPGRRIKPFQLLPAACSLTVIAICALAFAGWVGGYDGLVRIRSRYIPIAPNTIFCFIALSMSLLFLLFKSRNQLKTVSVLFGFVAVVSLARISEFLLGFDLDVDQWIFRAPEKSFGLVPTGKMAFPTALCFLLLCASFAVQVFWPKRPASLVSIALSLSTAILGLVFALGYAYGAPLLYGGTVIPMALNTAVCFVLAGIGHASLQLSREINDRRALEESKLRLAAIVDSSADAIIGKTLEGAITNWNRGAEKLYGYTEQEILGKHISHLAPPDKASEIEGLIYRLRFGERIRGYEMAAICKDGKLIDVSLTLSPIQNQAGKIIGVSVIARDITEKRTAEDQLRRSHGELQEQLLEQKDQLASVDQALQTETLERKRTEQALEESERRFAALVHEAPDPMVTLTLFGFIESLNREAEISTGYKAEELIGKHFSRAGVVSLKSLPKALKEFALLIAGQNRLPFQLETVAKDGAKRTYEANPRLIRVGGKPERILVIFRDVSERKKTEQQLIQSQRMEAIGLLAGGVAHDFNNHLSVIMASAAFITANPKNAKQVLEDAEEIKKAAERSASLTRQLLAFSRRQALEPKQFNLNTVITDMEKMLRRLIGEHIELDVKLDPQLGDVKADPGQIEQVIMNLVVNARDAMENGGKLVLETSNVAFKNKAFIQKFSLEPGRYVKITVKDSGIGISEDVLSHIFEPFFTTKEKGKGTGLGLSTVYGIIKQSGGHILVDSKEGQGTSFHIYLPQVSKQENETHGEMPQIGSLHGNETILIVEDEHGIRDVAKRILKTYGYTILEAQNPGEALLICEKTNGPIHLLLTDMVMPYMNGYELAQRAAALRPEMKVLFMSGYADPDMLQAVISAKKPFLAKPIEPETMARKIREILEKPSQAAAA